MKKFRHHAYFAKPKVVQAYRFPFVCLSCRKSFKFPAALRERHCPQCAGPMVMLSRKFSAPKCKDLAQWAKVRFLIGHGFRFYPVFDPCAGGMLTARYPDTLAQARWFVQRFASQPVRQCADLPCPTVDLHTDKWQYNCRQVARSRRSSSVTDSANTVHLSPD